MSLATKTWNKEVAEKYQQSISILESIESLNELITFSYLKYHPLTGNLKGKYSIKLGFRERLIFSIKGDNLELIRIEKVSKTHYGN